MYHSHRIANTFVDKKLAHLFGGGIKAEYNIEETKRIFKALQFFRQDLQVCHIIGIRLVINVTF